MQIIESVDGWSKSHFSSVFWMAMLLWQLCLKKIANEASEEKNEKISVLGIKKS